MIGASKKFIEISIWVAIALFALRCWVGWTDLNATITGKTIIEFCYLMFGYAGEAIGIAAPFMAVFNKWLWRWKPLNLLAGGKPILSKRYKATLRFKEADQDQVRDSEISIEQTFLNVSVRLETDESFSNSITAAIKEENGSKMLIYTYLNTPRAEIQDMSAIHYGTAMLDVNDPKHITGNYYTTRLSRGSMELEAVEKTK